VVFVSFGAADVVGGGEISGRFSLRTGGPGSYAKIEAQSEKPTWTKAERNSAKFDVTTRGRNPHLAIGSAGSESDEPGSAEHDR
jgi:hypothetical protein